MKVLDKFPPALEARCMAKGFSAIECDCGIVFAHHENKGTIAVCPSCALMADVTLNPLPPYEGKTG